MPSDELEVHLRLLRHVMRLADEISRVATLLTNAQAKGWTTGPKYNDRIELQDKLVNELCEKVAEIRKRTPEAPLVLGTRK